MSSATSRAVTAADLLATLRALGAELRAAGIRRLSSFGSVARGNDHAGSGVDPAVLPVAMIGATLDSESLGSTSRATRMSWIRNSPQHVLDVILAAKEDGQHADASCGFIDVEPVYRPIDGQ
jgi:hypothetical protein